MKRSKTLTGISLLAGVIVLAGCATHSDSNRSGGAATGSVQSDDSSNTPSGKTGGEAGRSGYGTSGGAGY
jgi:uncharacterized lipoprotein YajG